MKWADCTMNMSALKGYAYEYALAKHLEDVSGGRALISHDDKQLDLSSTRREHYRELEENHGDVFNEIDNMAKHHSTLLPQPSGDICFVETTNNAHEVYDIYYHDKNDQFIKVSCKTKEVFDKSYSLNSNKYPLEELNHIVISYMMNSQDVTHKEFMENNPNFMTDMVECIYNVLENGETQGDEYMSLLLLCSEHVVGNGGYYKTIPDGGVRYYPENHDGSVFYIQDGSVRKKDLSLSFVFVIVSPHDGFEQNYIITVSPGWKNNMSSSIVKTKNGFPKGLVLNFSMKLPNAHMLY